LFDACISAKFCLRKGLCNPICHYLYTPGRVVEWAAAGWVDKQNNNNNNNNHNNNNDNK
jgi:hypothetical protein